MNDDDDWPDLCGHNTEYVWRISCHRDLTGVACQASGGTRSTYSCDRRACLAKSSHWVAGSGHAPVRVALPTRKVVAS